MAALHAYEPSPWGRRIGIALVLLVALALAGYVGSVVGPHFASSSTTKPTTPPAHTHTTTPPPVVRADVKILVANGTQEPYAAAHFTQQLQQQGWSVITPLNATSAASTTTVYYAPSQQRAAAMVAGELGLPLAVVQPLSAATPVPNAALLDVVVVIGPNLAGNGFPPTTVGNT